LKNYIYTLENVKGKRDFFVEKDNFMTSTQKLKGFPGRGEKRVYVEKNCG